MSDTTGSSMTLGGTTEYFEEHYEVRPLAQNVAKEYITNHHYTHGCHNAPGPCYGLYEDDRLIGALLYANPCTDAVRKSVWGPEMKESVIELHRLYIEDGTPRNTESWFIMQCQKRLHEDRPEIKGVLSFADSTEGHVGTIYKATNFHFVGKTSPTYFYVDETGRLRHPHQNSKNVTKKQAEQLGWKRVRRQAKFRYLQILADDRRERRMLEQSGRYDVRHFEWCMECGKPHRIGEKCKCGEKELVHEAV